MRLGSRATRDAKGYALPGKGNFRRISVNVKAETFELLKATAIIDGVSIGRIANKAIWRYFNEDRKRQSS